MSELEYLKELKKKISKANRKLHSVFPEEFVSVFESIDNRIKILSKDISINKIAKAPIQQWLEILNKEEYQRIFKLCKATKPIKTNSSLHVHEEQYLIENRNYRIFYAIGDDEEDLHPLIEMLKN